MSRECLFNIITTEQNADSSRAKVAQPPLAIKEVNQQLANVGRNQGIRDYTYAIAKGMLSFIA